MAQSNEPTIEQMNEAIARFVGGARIQHPSQNFFSEDHFGYVCHKGHWWDERNLQYHTSWDWLMPVVEKIEGMEWCVRVENWPKKFKSPYKELYSVWMWLDPEDCPEIQTYSDSKIEAVYNAVYQFITWYNQQPQTNEQNNG